MKKVFLLAFCFVMIFTFNSYAKTMYTTTDVNLRKGASIESEKITTLPINTEVNVLESGEWSKVEYDGKERYICSKYLSEHRTARRTYLGKFRITHYCSCSKCCGKWGNVTKSGTVPMRYRTAGALLSQLPLGSLVEIEGYGTRIIEDTGSGAKSNHIDVYVGNDHSYALKLGTVYRNVYLLEE